MCTSVIKGWYVSYIGPESDVVHIHVLTLGKNMDLYVETPGTCQPERIMC